MMPCHVETLLHHRDNNRGCRWMCMHSKKFPCSLLNANNYGGYPSNLGKFGLLLTCMSFEMFQNLRLLRLKSFTQANCRFPNEGSTAEVSTLLPHCILTFYCSALDWAQIPVLVAFLIIPIQFYGVICSVNNSLLFEIYSLFL